MLALFQILKLFDITKTESSIIKYLLTLFYYSTESTFFSQVKRVKTSFT